MFIALVGLASIWVGLAAFPAQASDTRMEEMADDARSLAMDGGEMDESSPHTPNALDLAGLSVGYGFSSAGISLVPAYRINEDFGVRGHFSWFSPPKQRFDEKVSGDIGIGDTDIRAIDGYDDIGTSSFGLLMDVFATRRDQGFQFRGTMGLMRLNYYYEADVVVDKEVDFVKTGESFHVASADLGMGFGGNAPYLGMGLDFGGATGWGVSLDIGAAFRIKPHVTLSAYATNPSDQAALDDALDEELAELRRELSEIEDLPFFPVISLNSIYRF